MPTSRLEAFSDAVMAIAITLMALEIDLPTSGQSGLWHGLAAQWPAFAAYAVSFFTIGTIWVNHHLLFDRMARVDRALLYLNLLLLMLVALLPLPTALVAQYLHHGTNARAAAMLYSGALLAMGLTYSGLAHYAARVQHLRADHLTSQQRKAVIVSNLVGQGGYVLAILLAWISAPASLAMCGAVGVYYALPGRMPRGTPSG
jgi:uncharacterized membrane protein